MLQWEKGVATTSQAQSQGSTSPSAASHTRDPGAAEHGGVTGERFPELRVLAKEDERLDRLAG